jgi:hypothetical protein
MLCLSALLTTSTVGLNTPKLGIKTGKHTDLLLPPYTVMISHFNRIAMRICRLYGCVCDSSWTVGLAATLTQGAEWFGPHCSMRRCPGGNDPNTAVLTRNCNATATPDIVSEAHPLLDVGALGNLCLAERSNRGVTVY